MLPPVSKTLTCAKLAELTDFTGCAWLHWVPKPLQYAAKVTSAHAACRLYGVPRRFQREHHGPGT